MAVQYALKIQRKVNKGWKKEAKKLGQLWDVVRNGVVTTVGQPYILTRWHAGSDIELETVSYIYRARGDRTILQIGDQLVGKDPASTLEQDATVERYTVVGMRLLHDNIVVKTDRLCTIHRPLMNIPQGDSDPTYSIQTYKKNFAGLTLAGSTWSFVPSAVGTPVYCGITFGRLRDYEIPDPNPLSVHAQGWMVTLGLLPGVILAESDMIVDPDNNWYRINRPQYFSSAAFLYQLHCTRVLD